MARGAGPHTSECIKSKGAKETEVLLEKGKATNFQSLQPAHSEMS